MEKSEFGAFYLSSVGHNGELTAGPFINTVLHYTQLFFQSGVRNGTSEENSTIRPTITHQTCESYIFLYVIENAP